VLRGKHHARGVAGPAQLFGHHRRDQGAFAESVKTIS
jgi:hypothetical protein